MIETTSFSSLSTKIHIQLLLMVSLSCTSIAAGLNGPNLKLGGCGGVYFYAPAGPLRVEVFKQDLNRRGRKTHMWAMLFGPDRKVADQTWIEDDGQRAGTGPGPVRTATLQTDVKRPGVYGLNITVTQDRYGENISWGFRTNCPKYLIETSRGHRDARHVEPIVLRSPDTSAGVGFRPRTQPFSVEISGLPKGVEEIPVLDASGKTMAAMKVTPQGTAGKSFPADPLRKDSLWQLQLERAQATINIDGVTRWESGKPRRHLSLWTPDLSSWFDFHGNRWLLAPYSRNVYAAPGSEGQVEFRLHNNGPKSKSIKLSLESDRQSPWRLNLSADQVKLAAGASRTISLKYKAPSGKIRTKCHLRASVLNDGAFSTWSSLTLNVGTPPADSAVKLPIKLEPYEHENAQFGYLPDYPLDNQMYFDTDNRPFVLADDGIFALRGGSWAKTIRAQRGDTGKRIGIRPVGTKIAFDTDNNVYFLGRDGGTTLLFHSEDNARSFTAWPVPGSGSFDIEQFSGHNTPAGPPPLARFRQTARDPKLMWRRINDLHLILPTRKPDGYIEMGTPIAVSDTCIGLSAHSGIPSTIVSRDNKVHIAWGQATDPDKKVPGVPTCVATYDRSKAKLGPAALVGYGPPANDIHNSPCITMDRDGYLHVLIGTHGRTFKYVRSLAPNTADAGWTKARDVGPGLRQTYVGMVCDRENTLHLVFRLWLHDNKYFPEGNYGNLAYMRKEPRGEWSDAIPLVVAPFSEYSIFYHRLTIDRNSTLFLSYDYWSTFWFYRTDHPGDRRALLMSPDGGDTWQLAPNARFTGQNPKNKN